MSRSVIVGGENLHQAAAVSVGVVWASIPEVVIMEFRSMISKPCTAGVLNPTGGLLAMGPVVGRLERIDRTLRSSYVSEPFGLVMHLFPISNSTETLLSIFLTYRDRG